MAKTSGLGGHILLGRGEEKNEGRRNSKIVSSCFEALVGAMYLDSDFVTAARVVGELFQEILDSLIGDELRINDYKSELQELIQKHRNILPATRWWGRAASRPTPSSAWPSSWKTARSVSGTGRNRRRSGAGSGIDCLEKHRQFYPLRKAIRDFLWREAQELEDLGVRRRA